MSQVSRRLQNFALGVGLGVGLSAVMSFSAIPTLADSHLVGSPFAQLPETEQAALRQGEILVAAEGGRYQGKVLVKADPAVVWAVLTDYGSFSKFIPNVVSSEILESDGHQKVIEQISIRQVFVVSVRSRVRSRVTETPQKHIDFEMIDGDLESLQGRWQLEPIALSPEASPTQVLIAYTATAEPPSGPFEDAFPDVYKSALKDTLMGIRDEVTSRSRSR